MTEPREDYKPHVPRIEQMTVRSEFIGAIIGPGGKIIQEIQADTNATIVIEQDGDIGIIDISAENKASIEAAKDRIKAIIAEPEEGEVYKGKVKSITTFGAFVEILPGKEGLLHISEIAWEKINSAEDYLKPGEEVEVKLIEVDKKTGKLRLSRKALLPKPEGYKPPERGSRPPRGDNRNRGDRNDRYDRNRGGDRNRGDRNNDRRGGGNFRRRSEEE